MQALWNANGAQRRRRILIDESSTPEAAKAQVARCTGDENSKQERARRCYDPAALDGQPRVTDLIPCKRWVLALLMLFWGLQISGIVYLHTQLDRWNDFIGNPGLAPLDLAGFAGVATWFSSATLLLAAIGSWQVYNVRRHKTDDYRGTYRLWFWTAAWLVLASMEVTAGLRSLVRETATHFSGSTLAGRGDLLWILVIGLPSLALGIRLAFEMRKSKTAVAFAFAAGIAYLYAAVFQLGYVPLDEQLIVLHRWTAVLTAHGLVLATVAIYARYVFLDAQGQVGKVVKSKKPKRQRSEKASSDSEQDAQVRSESKRIRSTEPKADAKSNESTKARSTPTSEEANVSSKQPVKTSKRKLNAAVTKKTSAEKDVVTQAEEQAEKQAGATQSDQVAHRKSKKQKRRERLAQTQQQGSPQQAVKKEQNTSPTPAQKTAKQNTSANQAGPKLSEQTPDFMEIEDDEQDFQRLSKAERRKMRKQRRNDIRRAA